MPRLLAVDVGIVHLALVSVDALQDAVEVLDVRLVDLTTLPCLPGCTLPHSRNIVDRVEHLFAAHGAVFAAADEVLIEAQPLMGLVHVEALIYSRFRGKARMVSPAAMHRHFGLPRGDYDGRKAAAEALAAPFLTGFRAELAAMARTHDVADAVCMALYVVQARHRADEQAAEAAAAAEAKRARLERLRAHDNPLNPFSRFACSGTPGAA